MLKLLALLFTVLAGPAFAQCNGVFPANTVCSNLGGSPAAPGPNVLTVPTQSVGTSNTSPASTQFTQQAIANVPLQPPGTNNGTAASTAFVQAAIGSGPPATSINGSGPTAGTTIVGGVNNGMLSDTRSAGTDYITAETPSAFWNNFCGVTIGYIWARMTGGWACGSAYDAPVTWWGAKCDGSTDDTANINTAIASGVKSLSFPGICNVATLAQVPAYVTLHGQNWLGSCIRTTSATGDVVTLSTNDEVKDLCFTSTVTRTNGAFLHIGAVGANVANVALSRLWMDSYYDGIHLNDAQFIRGTDIEMVGQSWSHDGILVDGTSGVTQPYNTDIDFVDTVITQGTNGVEVIVAGDISFTRLQVYHSGNGFNIVPNGAPASGNIIQYLSCVACLFDSNTSNGVNISPTNGGYIFTLKFADNWIASNTLYGVNINTDTGHSSTVAESNWIDDLVSGNTCGYVINNTSNAAVNNTNIIGGSISGNTGLCNAGIWVGVGAQTLRVQGVNVGQSAGFGGNGVGINFQAGSGNACTNCQINNNTLIANSQAINLAAGPILTGFISNNIGYHSGTPNTATACGGAAIVGNDYSGTITTAPNSCNIVFANLWQTPPSCMWVDLTGTRAGMSSVATTNYLGIGAINPGDNIAYACTPGPGN